MKSLLRLSVVALLLCASVQFKAVAQQQEPSSPPATSQSAEPAKQKNGKQPTSIGGELAKEEREATGEEEENAKLKHSSMVRKLAVLTGGDVHRAHLLALGINFAIIVGVVFYFGRKFLPGVMRRRTESIQRAIEEARAASQDANRRLTDIENRLRQLDVEIGQMQAAAEKEGDAEEARIRATAEEDIRKVIESAEQEIAAAAKQARREITAHTADLAIALAQKQISVDSRTDQELVRAFSSKLSGGKDGN